MVADICDVSFFSAENNMANTALICPFQQSLTSLPYQIERARGEQMFGINDYWVIKREETATTKVATNRRPAIRDTCRQRFWFESRKLQGKPVSVSNKELCCAVETEAFENCVFQLSGRAHHFPYVSITVCRLLLLFPGIPLFPIPFYEHSSPSFNHSASNKVTSIQEFGADFTSRY